MFQLYPTFQKILVLLATWGALCAGCTEDHPRNNPINNNQHDTLHTADTSTDTTPNPHTDTELDTETTQTYDTQKLTCAQPCDQLPNTAQASCFEGQCVLLFCDAGFGDCDQDPNNGCEINLGDDTFNCGACQARCKRTDNVETFSCISGACSVLSCVHQYADCDADYANGCETFGGQNDYCNASDTCQGPADASNTVIDGQNEQAEPPATLYINCADPASFGADPDGVWSCQPDHDQSGFTCIWFHCNEGFAACRPGEPSNCEPLNTTLNCGFCGHSCADGATCEGSTCQCPGDEQDGERCQARGFKFDSASCDGSDCVLRCDQGWADCDQDPTNGCEIQTTNDPNHCGACHQACVRFEDNISAGTCVNGACAINQCLPGFANCDGDLANGCEQYAPNSSCFSYCGDAFLDDNEQCDAFTLPTSNCNLDCTLSRCGDGLRNSASAEQCDDANTLNGDGCSDSCTIETGFGCSGPNNGLSVCAPMVCGDGFVVGTEQCDSTILPTAGCDIDCTFAVCGDGRRNVPAGEYCDDGNTYPWDGCSPDCQLSFDGSCDNYLNPPNELSQCISYHGCGNGFLNPGETCDDGNFISGDGCSAGCWTEFGYVCVTNPAPNPPISFGSTCASTCGDGLKAAEEACDDANLLDGDGCSAGCTIEAGYVCTGTAPSICRLAFCGNGTVDEGELCDDGNLTHNDGCTSFCRIENGYLCNTESPSVCVLNVCGDGIRAWAEACDDANTLNGDGCSDTCAIEAGFGCSGPNNGLSVCAPMVCGDGFVVGTEQCDSTNLPTADCDIDCTFAVCGDGRRNVPAGEYCDDGNTYPWDGCSPDCQLSFDGACNSYLNPPNELSQCISYHGCGNGFITPGEACDDGNFISGDGCSLACSVEFGYLCTHNLTPNPPFPIGSTCTSTCGDGLKASIEPCDDGNNTDGDGCSANCQIE